jgi:hypothetical protein
MTWRMRLWIFKFYGKLAGQSTAFVSKLVERAFEEKYSTRLRARHGDVTLREMIRDHDGSLWPLPQLPQHPLRPTHLVFDLEVRLALDERFDGPRLPIFCSRVQGRLPALRWRAGGEGGWSEGKVATRNAKCDMARGTLGLGSEASI